jgi:hypothetical protein
VAGLKWKWQAPVEGSVFNSSDETHLKEENEG